jgi:hypothetical protein
MLLSVSPPSQDEVELEPRAPDCQRHERADPLHERDGHALQARQIHPGAGGRQGSLRGSTSQSSSTYLCILEGY